jgi:hypothetical protein
MNAGALWRYRYLRPSVQVMDKKATFEKTSLVGVYYRQVNTPPM